LPIDDDFVDRLIAEDDMELGVDRDILGMHVSDILSDMDEKYRNVLILRFMEDKSYSEISDIIKKPPGTVATYISRAKKQFHKITSHQQSMIINDV